MKSAAWITPLIAGSLLVLLPAVLTADTHALAVRILIYAVFALSLQLLVGGAGIVSFGHAAFFGIGAFITVLGTGTRGAASALWLLPAAMLAAALYALFVGALSLRTRGTALVVATLLFAQMAYLVFQESRLGGGSEGLLLYGKPVLRWAGRTWLDLDNKRHIYFAALGALGFTYALLALLQRSRFGHALAGIRVNEQRMSAVGFPIYRYKLAAFVTAGALAGLAGFLLAAHDGFVKPGLLGWQESGTVLMMVMLGGSRRPHGAVLGAVAVTLLIEMLQSPAWVGPLAPHWQMTLGITILAVVALLPHGLVGLPKALRRPNVAARRRAGASS